MAYRRNTGSDIPLRFLSGQPMPMGYLDRLAELRKKRGFTQASLAERLGVEQPTVQRWEKGKREPDLKQLIELAAVLGVEPGNLLGGDEAAPIGPRLFVKGEVAAGVWRAAIELPEDEWQTFNGRSDVTTDIQHRFGLRVVSDSMDQVYPIGTIVECVSLFGRAEAVPGKRVVVVRMNDDGEYEATIKELVEKDGELWLVPRSSNPAHVPFRLSDRAPGIIETRIAAVVVSSVRPE
ncbi:XRE family transcriptional regulator [Sphingomonas sp. 1P06PA]|uniref:helix-turn-helix domain-containing protein n=1 Tax=Sphingomonas sp. 1P06PA TaxID=554121 RepID=UPI0039A559C3